MLFYLFMGGMINFFFVLGMRKLKVWKSLHYKIRCKDKKSLGVSLITYKYLFIDFNLKLIIVLTMKKPQRANI
jgi:hypothetical protein